MYRYTSRFMAALTCALSSLLLVSSPASAQNAGQTAYDIGVKQNEAKRYNEARVSFKAACDAGSVKGCEQYGYLLEKGNGGAVDLTGAMRIYSSACAKGNARACAGIGAVHVARKEFTKALPIFRKACDQGSIRGCVNYGYMHEKGEGTAINYDAAMSYYTKACTATGENISAGCHNVAVMTRDGLGRTADKQNALVLFKRNCDQEKYADSCYSAALLSPKTGREEERFKYAKAGCDFGNENSCHTAGMTYYRRMKSATTLSTIASYKNVAMVYYNRACDKGRTESCNIKLNTAQQERRIKNQEIRANNAALKAEWDAKSKAALRELNAFRPDRSACQVQTFQIYSGNQSSIDQANRILDSESSCIRRLRRSQTQRLHAIISKAGGYARLEGQTQTKMGDIKYSVANGCKCADEMTAAVERVNGVTNVLVAQNNKRRTNAQNILNNGW